MPPWTPLLEGDDAARARAAVDEIAAALRARPAADGSVFHGSGGRALFHAERALARGDEQDELLAQELLLESIAAELASPRPFAAAARAAWVAWHLGGEACEEVAAAADRRLRAVVEEAPWSGPVELIAGLAGAGLPALDRLHDAAAAATARTVVDRLDELAEEAERGRTWRTPARLVPLWQHDGGGRDVWNCGMAHGVPGVVAWLAAAVERGVVAARTSRLLGSAVDWLLGVAGEDGRCPSWIVDGGAREPARLAWCYGELGVAAALAHAGRVLAREDALAEARRLGRAAAARRDHGILDAGLCHGAAGAAHLFAALHAATGDGDLADAARAWYRHLLAARRPEGLAGFAAAYFVGDAIRWDPDPGFLGGAAGVGLALLAATEERDPGWDMLLLAR